MGETVRPVLLLLGDLGDAGGPQDGDSTKRRSRVIRSESISTLESPIEYTSIVISGRIKTSM